MYTMVNVLTVEEFFGIQRNLKKLSETWSDLWAMLHISQASPTHIICLKFSDVENGRLVLRSNRRLALRYVEISPGIEKILVSRRTSYPEDEYLFQSHTNRTLSNPRPVTLIAFNAALKTACRNVTCKTVSSKSAAFLK